MPQEFAVDQRDCRRLAALADGGKLILSRGELAAAGEGRCGGSAPLAAVVFSAVEQRGIVALPTAVDGSEAAARLSAECRTPDDPDYPDWLGLRATPRGAALAARALEWCSELAAHLVRARLRWRDAGEALEALETLCRWLDGADGRGRP